MKPLKVLMVDDEVLQHQQIKQLLSTLETPVTLYCFQSGAEFFFHWPDHQDCDIILLDVEMPQMNGLEIARKIRESDSSVPLVFITAFGQYAIKGYEVMAIAYLLKPVSKQQIEDVLTKVEMLSHKEEKSLILTINQQTMRVYEKEIYAIESIGHKLIISYHHQKVEINESLKDITQRLSNDFIQTHRSFLVNINHIFQIKKDSILLDNHQEVLLSRRLYKQVLNLFVKKYQQEGYSL